MANITFIQRGGKEHTIDLEDGISLMQGAVNHNIPGIEADCGGSLSCGTCRVYISPDWADKSGQPCHNEQQMLEFSGNDKENARLSCQITVCPDLDGLVVYVPESQK